MKNTQVRAHRRIAAPKTQAADNAVGACLAVRMLCADVAHDHDCAITLLANVSTQAAEMLASNHLESGFSRSQLRDIADRLERAARLIRALRPSEDPLSAQS